MLRHLRSGMPEHAAPHAYRLRGMPAHAAPHAYRLRGMPARKRPRGRGLLSKRGLGRCGMFA